MILTFLDIETSGYDFRVNDILQVSFVRADENGNVHNAGNLYFYQPDFNVETDAYHVHGLTRENLMKYEADYTKNCAALHAIMQKGYIVGKNSDRFDIPFISGWLMRKFPGMLPPVKLFRQADIQTAMVPFFRDWWYNKNGFETKKSGTLGEYVAMLNLEQEVDRVYDIAQGYCPEPARKGFHDALYDAVATYCVWRVMREKNWINL